VFLLDEIDKMSTDFRGDPSAALLEVLDPEQNHSFNDHYLDLDYDLSNIMFITTANSLHSIPAPLQDRMEIIQLPGYTEFEKTQIANSYLIKKQQEANGLQGVDVEITETAVRAIINHYTKEAGVRSLEREIASVCRKLAKEMVKKTQNNNQPTSVNKAEEALRMQFRVTSKSLPKYLGAYKFRYGKAEGEHEIGLTNGLAVTMYGGDLLTTETSVMPGKGKLLITGKLGDVMQESAQAAMTYIRTRADALGLEKDFYAKYDIHIHFPEGAIPKDGPSAGITMATSLASALARIPVRKDVAMTGEITLRGRVLPIGGLKEKILAAHRAGIQKVIIPAENRKDIKDIPKRVLRVMKIVMVEHMDQVLREALLIENQEAFLRKSPPALPTPTITADIPSSPEPVVHSPYRSE
jgi:ATP-dependent Lon protease